MGLEKFRNKGRVDYLLAFAIFIVSVFGVIMVFSASGVLAESVFGNLYHFARKQAMALIVGLVLMIVLSRIDYRIWRQYATAMLWVTVILLVAVFLPWIGVENKGAHRWLDLGFVTFQPSELVKITFLLYLSAWLCKKGKEINVFASGFVPFVAILGIVTFLVMAQPDMGSMTVIAAIATVIFLISGVSWKYVFIYLGGIFLAFRLLIIIEPYRMERFTVFLNPASALQGAGYQINQAMLAIGSGGWVGLGFGQSRQKYLYLPEPHTDSIFAIIAEELGFIRIILLVAVFVFIAWRGYRIALKSSDMFGRLVASGITTWIIWQAFVNMGAMTGLLPLTGVTLPFISYGGTSLIVTLAAVGILLNISRRNV